MENTAKQYQEETISAVCTALGEGAIGIIRISGENALAAGEAIFKAASGRKLADYPVNTLVYARASFLYGRRCCGNSVPWRCTFFAENFIVKLCRRCAAG